MSEKLIIIDPGHGGDDPGAVNGSKYEKAATLAIAKKVACQLIEAGYTVALTRSTDRELSLPERCRFANGKDAAAYISIHLNAAESTKAEGLETWRYKSVGSTTKKLADEVHAELIAATGAVDRGVKTTTAFYVLKNTKAPAILVECGFISNGDECKKLFNATYQSKIAQAIAKGVKRAIR